MIDKETTAQMSMKPVKTEVKLSYTTRWDNNRTTSGWRRCHWEELGYMSKLIWCTKGIWRGIQWQRDSVLERNSKLVHH